MPITFVDTGVEITTTTMKSPLYFKGILKGIFLDSSVKLWTPKQLYLIFQKRNEKRENTARL